MAENLVEVVRHEGVATLHLNRPDRRNALDAGLMRALAQVLDAVRDDAEVRVVVLRGNGPAFSSGIDHSLLIDIMQRAQTVPFAHLHRDLQDVFHRIERMEKPVIAALHRVCVGMALELALACDFRLSTADCALGLPEIAFGIIPDVGGTTRLVRAIGYQRAKWLILTGQIITAERALGLGLIDGVVHDGEALDAEVRKLAKRLCGFSSLALGKGKALLRHAADSDAAMAFELEGLTQEVLMRQADLPQRFAEALALIKEGIARPAG